MATAASSTQTEKQVSLKLLVNKEKNKVIFAEAGKDFVDVLCSFLTLPLGTIARLVGKGSNIAPVRIGCLSSLLESVAKLDVEHLCSKMCKEMLLLPRNSAEHYCRNLKLNIDDKVQLQTKCFFVCDRCCSALLSTCGYYQECDCGNTLSQAVSLKNNGFVNGVTFIITDDLAVIPNSMYTSFGLFRSCGIDSISSVHEMTVNVSKKKVLDLLKCSLLSKTTLTALFLEKQPIHELFERTIFSLCESAANSSVQINVNLMVRKSNGKIVFAQGEEDFADFLFSFLIFPLGGVVHMLGGYSSLGSIDGLYKSIVDLNGDRYLMTKEVKKMLVDPRLPPNYKLSKQMLPICKSDAINYYCYYDKELGFEGSVLTDQCYLTCGYENYGSSQEACTSVKLVEPISSAATLKAFAKGPATYMVTDNLVVSPMSPISAISLLNRLKIPISDLEEKAVSIGVKEGLNILKASLHSTSALTNGLGHLLAKIKEEK